MFDSVAQIVQIAGSLCVLVPFVLVQRGQWVTTSGSYLVANLVGSTVLAVDAAVSGQWGFLLLEGVWAMVSIAALRTRRFARAAAR